MGKTTYSEHSPHAKAFDLSEAFEGLGRKVFDEAVQGSIQKALGNVADLCVYSYKGNQSLIHVRSYIWKDFPLER